MFENEVEKLKDEMVIKTCRLIQIPSVYEEGNNPTMPFGKNVNKALEYILDLGEQLGFRTKNIDGYCGYIEFGEGEELVGIIGHLDVVPVGEGWTYEPFSGVVKDGKLYGRGAIDDKGPIMASLYAMKAVMENAKVNKRVRLILGLNEETEWKCIKYYKEHEELPTISFSPDANFPCIYAEKGFLSTYIKENYSNYLNEPLVITNIDCNNNAINVVPKICSCTIKSNNPKIDINTLDKYVQTVAERHLFDVTTERISNIEIKITSYGSGAHAAHPELGDNAISKLIVLLQDVFSNYNANIGILHLFNKYINTGYNGEDLKLDIADESGKFTLNVGTFKLEDDKIQIGLNIRVPVNTALSVVENKLVEVANPYKNIEVETVDSKDALYVSKDDFLVTTLCDIFNKVTGENKEPIAIGGATYARAFNNCVSFGANMPDDEDMCHQADEFISIDNLVLASKIYAEAIYELAK